MIELTVTDGVGELVINAPEKLNAVDVNDLNDLRVRLDEAAAADVRALILRGEGRGFSAGRDISNVDPANDDVNDFLDVRVGGFMRAMRDFPAPTFAAVHGACLGAGLGLAIACDVVYVSEAAKIGSPFANLGAILDSGGHWLFVERLGAHRTLDLMYTAELMSGAEAVAAGMFSRVVPDGELLEFTRTRAAKVAQGPTAAFMASKALVRELTTTPMGQWQALDLENAAQAQLQQSADFREGFTAFQEKRRPVFRGE